MIRDERGLSSIAFIAAAGIALVTMVMFVNFIVFFYARGVVRAALDEGVRAGSRVDANEAVCDAEIRDVMDDGLGGELEAGVSIEPCQVLPNGRMTVVARVSWQWWLPVLDADPGDMAWEFDLQASSFKERAP